MKLITHSCDASVSDFPNQRLTVVSGSAEGYWGALGSKMLVHKRVSNSSFFHFSVHTAYFHSSLKIVKEASIQCVGQDQEGRGK